MFEEVGTTIDGDMIINVGPQHPATHGVLHLVITLNGETIKKLSHTWDLFTALLRKCVKAFLPSIHLCYQPDGLSLSPY